MKLLATFLLVLAACTDTPSGSTCPTTDAPTYQSFGQPFMTKYCTGCHSTTAQNRHGAPADQNYDTEMDIIHHVADIDLVAAAGPKAQNTIMPDMSGPVHVAPSMEERTALGQFLACEKAAQ